MTALVIGPLGPLEIALIVGVVVLLFGVGRISGLGRDFGKSIREFRRAVKEDDEEEGAEGATTAKATTQSSPPAQQQASQQASPPSESSSSDRNVF